MSTIKYVHSNIYHIYKMRQKEAFSHLFMSITCNIVYLEMWNERSKHKKRRRRKRIGVNGKVHG
jgi:hypothetical protein